MDKAFKLSGIAFYGGSAYTCMQEDLTLRPTLVINMSDQAVVSDNSAEGSFFISTPEWWPNYMEDTVKQYTPVEVVLNWPDMSAPPFSYTLWTDIYSKIKAEGIEQVMVCCAGGMGRTGTVLSSFLITKGGYTPDAAVKFVRDNYNKRAVESRAQHDYLVDMWGDMTNEPVGSMRKVLSKMYQENSTAPMTYQQNYYSPGNNWKQKDSKGISGVHVGLEITDTDRNRTRFRITGYDIKGTVKDFYGASWKVVPGNPAKLRCIEMEK